MLVLLYPCCTLRIKPMSLHSMYSLHMLRHCTGTSKVQIHCARQKGTRSGDYLALRYGHSYLRKEHSSGFHSSLLLHTGFIEYK